MSETARIRRRRWEAKRNTILPYTRSEWFGPKPETLKFSSIPGRLKLVFKQPGCLDEKTEVASAKED